MNEVTEYAVWDNEENEVLINTATDRERAFRLARYWNTTKEGRVSVVQRAITTSEWKLANEGGIVE